MSNGSPHGKTASSMRFFRLSVLSALVASSVLTGASAEGQVGIRVFEVGDGGVRVDGMLRDWRGVAKVGVGRGADASMELSLGYDGAGLYVAADVADERLVRAASPSREQDAIVITIAVPRGRSFQTSEIWIYPGNPHQSGSAAIGSLGGRLRAIPDAQVVEARSEGGYEIEAFIPWRRIPGSRNWQEGRMAVRLNDVDSESRPQVENEPATAQVDRRHLDRLPNIRPSGGQNAVLDRFLSQQGITGATPRHQERADVCGDRRPERVVQVERFVVVFGAGYRDANAYDFAALPVQGAGDVHGFQLRDYTGDGKAELQVEMTQRDGRGSRRLWQLFTFDCRSIQPLFAIETRKEVEAGHVQSRVRVARGGRGKPPKIEVRIGDARGLTPENFRESPSTDAQSILLPWGPQRSRVYQWDGERFAVVQERANPNHREAQPQQREQRSRRQTRQTRQTRQSRRPSQGAAAMRALVTAVREEKNIPARIRPRFVWDRNVEGSRAVERVAVLGDALIVVGPEFRGGNGYFYYQLPVEGHADIRRVTTADLDGDGKHEILIRVRQDLGEVERDVLLVHQFRGGEFPRLLAVEVERVQGDKRIDNEIRTSRRGLEIRPGRARGWSAGNWPWADAPAGDGIEPILKPWADRPVQYRLRGGQLRR